MELVLVLLLWQIPERSRKLYPGSCWQRFRLTAGWFHHCAPVVKSDITESRRHQTLVTHLTAGRKQKERETGGTGDKYVFQRVNPLMMSEPSTPTPSQGRALVKFWLDVWWWNDTSWQGLQRLSSKTPSCWGSQGGKAFLESKWNVDSVCKRCPL